MSSISVNTITDASGGTTTSINGYTPTASNMAGRNRIINGDMRIDQRNAGAASANTINGYFLDRWDVSQITTGKIIAQQNAGSVTPPVGFGNYLGITSQSAYSVISTDRTMITQWIEGFNCADLNWGTANAKTVTLSFWVRSSLTGTFGGAFINYDGNRSYAFSYTVSSANTWEQKSVTVAGDTTGTWNVTNGGGIGIRFGLGVGSNYLGTAGAWSASNFAGVTSQVNLVGTSGATFYITGVQLEEGSVATSFEHRQYGQELALCQRYYFKQVYSQTQTWAYGHTQTTNLARVTTQSPVPMRATPSFSTNATLYAVYAGDSSGSAPMSSLSCIDFTGTNVIIEATVTGVSGFLIAYGYNGSNFYSAEL